MPLNDDPHPDQGSVGLFNTTHWSVVLAAGEPDSGEAQQALQTLCQAYWYPLYCYVRRAGHQPDDAQDLTQEFFSRLLEKNYVSLARRERGRFRSFLLASLKNFLTNEYHRGTRLKRGGGQAIISLDAAEAEDRYVAEPIEIATPETLFEQRWALALLENALSRLRNEYADQGRAPIFDLLKDYVWGERNAASYAEIAAQLDLTEEAVKKAVQRLRQRYRDMLRTEIAHTVPTAGEIDDELQHLVRLLRR
ncbi:MAG: sigma-70 family RNA polymerase sigma factor [Verrucomicrobiales bacterium]|nr:sigma-70 family RNA polymerase sigma factor [Verrucomicrobiales bacterium]